MKICAHRVDSNSRVPSPRPGTENLGMVSRDGVDLAPSVSTSELFVSDYFQARDRFRDSAKLAADQHPNAVLDSIAVENADGKDLTVDYLVLPATHKAKNVLFVSSGVHGGEGPVGSAAQELFLKEHLKNLDRSQTSVILVHAYNPWGYEAKHQYTEGNVDTNRNNLKDPELFKNYPPTDYKLVADWMRAESPPPTMYLETQLSGALGIATSLWRSGGSVDRIVNALGEGQLEDQRGVRYVGTESLPQREVLFDALKPHLETADQIIHLDVHTGIGDRGVLAMIDMSEPDSLEDSESFGKSLEAGGLQYAPGVLPGFYDNSLGDFTNNSEMLAKPGAKVLTYTAEVGTVGDGFVDKLETVFRLKERNELMFFADQVSDSKRAAILDRYAELFDPQDPEWRETVSEQFDYLFDKTTALLNSAELL